MTRSASKQDLVRSLGARPVVADALDPELRRRGRDDDRAARHHVDAIGDLEGHPHVLLDEQNREAFLTQDTYGLFEVCDDLRRDALGRLVEEQDAGSALSARAIASICCPPPLRRTSCSPARAGDAGVGP
jgi:hypothetical protein